MMIDTKLTRTRLAQLEGGVAGHYCEAIVTARSLLAEIDRLRADNEILHARTMTDVLNQRARAERAEAERDDYIGRYETCHASRMWAEKCYRREAEKAARVAALCEIYDENPMSLSSYDVAAEFRAALSSDR